MLPRWGKLVVAEGGSAHAGGLFFSPDKRHERVLPGLLGSMEYFDRAAARRQDGPIGECDPLTAILREKAVARCPVPLFVLVPVGMNSAGHFGWQSVAFHRHIPSGATINARK